jgi:hypothetical protein
MTTYQHVLPGMGAGAAARFGRLLHPEEELDNSSA